MKKALFLFLLLATGFSGIQAQRIIEGVVLNGANLVINGAHVHVKGATASVETSADGKFKIPLGIGDSILIVSNKGYVTQEVNVVKILKFVVVKMQATTDERKSFNSNYSVVKDEIQTGYTNNIPVMAEGQYDKAINLNSQLYGAVVSGSYYSAPSESESYSSVKENGYQSVNDQPLSTFSIDVDRASYSNVRRYLNSGHLPPVDAVRTEELINYFDYHYNSPTGGAPVAIYTDMARCPWDTTHQIVRIALKGKEVPVDNLPPANLVFLIDVSGSMSDNNKLPLIRQAMTGLVQQLRDKDRIAIVTYAGNARVALPSTAGSNKTKILDAINSLQAGGSTAGESGIKLAYETARKSFMKHGNNRIVLATDGDFNVGVSSEDELEKLVETKRESDIFLSVLGFGMGNYKDFKLEVLADKGNGNYAYIDNFEEARRTFVTEFGGTLFTIAKDVKLQVEFNPQYVQAYRLIGYENRLLENKDFNDDKKDAGDMGVGHTVTALYEVVPVGVRVADKPLVDSLKYQRTVAGDNYSGEALTVKLRYKEPTEDVSHLISQVLPWKMQDIKNAPEDFRLATAVATFGMLLHHSEYKGQANFTDVIALAKGAKGADEEGYRAEFIQLVKQASVLSKEVAAK